MSEVASRELRNQTRSVLDRAAGGELITITVDGRPVANLTATTQRPQWMARDRFYREVLGRIDLTVGHWSNGEKIDGTATNGDHANGSGSVVPARGLVDTSIFINPNNRTLDLLALPHEVAVSVVTISELRAGVLSATDTVARDRRLTTLTGALAMNPLPIDEEIAAGWARLRVELRDLDQRMPINDSWVAATAMTLGVAVVTQFDDFPTGISDLTVIKV